MPIKRLAICLLLMSGLLLSSQVSAGIVPGTIQKASGTSSALQCNTSNSTAYRTSYSCTDTSTCATYEIDRSSSCGCERYQQIDDKSSCEAYSSPSCLEYNKKNGSTCLEYWEERCTQNIIWCDTTRTYYPWMSEDECRRQPGWTPRVKTTCSQGQCIRYNQIDDLNSCKRFGESTCIRYKQINWPTCAQYNQCRSSSHRCETYETSPSFSTSIYKNMEANSSRPKLSSLYNLPNGYIYYNNEGNNSCYIAVDWSDHTSARWYTQTRCTTSNSYYYSTTWKNWSCNISSAKNYLITSYNQIWDIRTSTPATKQNICSVEWRIAVQDTTWPKVTVTSKNFTNNETKWCNLNKYKWLDGFSTYWDEKSPTTQGCEYYKNLSSFSWNNPDLVSDLQVTISDNSAISKVTIELGTCSANISLTTDLSKLENNWNWVKASVQSLTLFGHKTSSYAWDSIASLKTLFNVDRLDDCLGNGRNYIKVISQDNARSTSNIKVLDSNTNIYSTASTQFINIDNLGVSFGVDVKSNPPSTSNWYDHTVSGKFKFEDLTDSGDPICKAYEKGEADTCTGKPNNSYWVSPSWINPDTWVHNIYTCDGEPLSVNWCDWTCDNGFEKKNGKCEPVITQTSCWTLWTSRLGFDTTVCNYTPEYSWHTKKDSVCNGSFYMQSSVCKDQYGKLASEDMCKGPKPSTTVPCSLESQWFIIGRDTIWDNSKTIWK